jgi:hypothetical protein
MNEAEIDAMYADIAMRREPVRSDYESRCEWEIAWAEYIAGLGTERIVEAEDVA